MGHSLSSGWHQCLGAMLPRIFQISGTVFKNKLVPAIVYGATCVLRRFAIYDRGGASEPAVDRRSTALHVTHTLASTSTELVFRGCAIRCHHLAPREWVNAWRMNRQRGVLPTCALLSCSPVAPEWCKGSTNTWPMT